MIVPNILLAGVDLPLWNILVTGKVNHLEKYESQLGWLFPIYGKIKFMFQTTNQLILLWDISLQLNYSNSTIPSQRIPLWRAVPSKRPLLHIDREHQPFFVRLIYPHPNDNRLNCSKRPIQLVSSVLFVLWGILFFGWLISILANKALFPVCSIYSCYPIYLDKHKWSFPNLN